FEVTAPSGWGLMCEPGRVGQLMPMSITPNDPHLAPLAVVILGGPLEDKVTIDSQVASDRKRYTSAARVVDAPMLVTGAGTKLHVTEYLGNEKWPHWIAHGYTQVGQVVFALVLMCSEEQLFKQYYPAYEQVVQSLGVAAPDGKH